MDFKGKLIIAIENKVISYCVMQKFCDLDNINENDIDLLVKAMKFNKNIRENDEILALNSQKSDEDESKLSDDEKAEILAKNSELKGEILRILGSFDWLIKNEIKSFEKDENFSLKSAKFKRKIFADDEIKIAYCEF